MTVVYYRMLEINSYLDVLVFSDIRAESTRGFTEKLQ